MLDIGCGWGAVTRAIAERGAEAVVITLADQQLELSKQRVPKHMQDLITYHLQDYRIHAAENIGDYDRVVSIGMFDGSNSRLTSRRSKNYPNPIAMRSSTVSSRTFRRVPTVGSTNISSRAAIHRELKTCQIQP